MITERHLRLCDMCNINTLGDEYHLFFVCTNDNIVNLRNKYIARFYRNRPSMYKFVSLIKSLEYLKMGLRVGFFLNIVKLFDK